MKTKKIDKTALVQAVDLLARQEHSKQKLTEKLEKRGYEEAEIEGAIDRLEELHYLNDTATCKRQFDYFYENSHKSVREICQKLAQRGFAWEDIDASVPADTYEREIAVAEKLLRGKYRRDVGKNKMLQYLYRHGFEGSICMEARSAWEEAFEDAEDD